jgi:hypothetical protein
VFEDRSLADNVTRAVEKQLYYDERSGKQAITHLEESIPYKRFSQVGLENKLTLSLDADSLLKMDLYGKKVFKRKG